jgi:hypothetical protein
MPDVVALKLAFLSFCSHGIAELDPAQTIANTVVFEAKTRGIDGRAQVVIRSPKATNEKPVGLERSITSKFSQRPNKREVGQLSLLCIHQGFDVQEGDFIVIRLTQSAAR